MSLQLVSAQSWGLVVVLALAELTLVVTSRGLAKMFCVASLMLNHSIVLNGSRSFSCPCLLSIPACVQANGCSCYNFLVVPVVYCRGFQSWSLSWFFISSSMVLVLVLQKCSCLSPHSRWLWERRHLSLAMPWCYAMPVCRIRGQRLHWAATDNETNTTWCRITAITVKFPRRTANEIVPKITINCTVHVFFNCNQHFSNLKP